MQRPVHLILSIGARASEGPLFSEKFFKEWKKGAQASRKPVAPGPQELLGAHASRDSVGFGP